MNIENEAVVINNLNIMKLMDSLYCKEVLKKDNEAIYCEIQYRRDRSSFAGMAFKITSDENVITAKEHTNRIIKNVSKYEKLYIGCEQDYIDAIMEEFSLSRKNYGIDILFLIYSDVRSSKIIFEELIAGIDKNVDIIKHLVIK